MRIVVFGTGDYYRKNVKRFNKESIVALLDNNLEKEGTYLDGVKIYTPQKLPELDYDYIVILSLYEKEMYSQLMELGVSNDKVILYSELQDHPELNLKELDAKVLDSEKTIDDIIKSICQNSMLMLIGNLDLNGASIAFVNAALILKKHGYDVIIASAIEGKLSDLIIKNDIQLIIDPNILYKTFVEIKWLQSFHKIICNTLLFYTFLSDVPSDKNIMWWLHDPEILYSSLNKKILSDIDGDCLTVYAVGPVASNAIKKFHPEFDVKNLLYGIPEMNIDEHLASNKIEFAVIANVQEYKGQDIILHAMSYLTQKELDKIHIRVIGNQNSFYASELKKQSEKNKLPIDFISEIEREEIEKVYSEIDVLLCPSRVDCMPVSVAEAMSNRIPAIVSNSVGTVDYLVDGENGLVFDCNNPEMLAEKIRWCINNQTSIELLGKKAREVYKKYFSMEVFEKHLLFAVRNQFEN